MRLARGEFANRSQNIVKFRKICYSFANCEFFSAKWGCVQAKRVAPPSHPTPHLTPLPPHFTSRLCDLRHNPLG